MLQHSTQEHMLQNGIVNFGKLNQGASITGWKSTNPAITATIYPNTIPNSTGICLANPLKATQQKIVAANVIRATKKYFKIINFSSIYSFVHRHN